MKSLTNSEIPSSNPFQRACSGFQLFRNPPVILKIVPNARYECAQKKTTIEIKGKPEQKFDAAYGTIFRISKCFQEAGKNFILIFLLT
jgi:hypothetical protein